MSDDDERTNQEIASLSSFGTGLNSRTQSFASATSSQFSRQSRLPDYDFGEDDRPGVYKSGKQKRKDKTKNNKKTETKGNNKVKEKQKEQNKKNKKNEKNDVKKRRNEKGESEKKDRKKVNKKGKESKVIEKKNKSKTKKEKTSENCKVEETAPENQDREANKTCSKSDDDESFINELNAAVEARSDNVEEDSSKRVNEIVTQSEDNMTSRESSAVRGRKKKTDKKKKKNGKKSSSRGRSASKKKKPKRGKSGKRKTSRTNSTGSCSDVTSGNASDTSTNRKKTKKGKKGKKTNTKKDGPTIITINDDDEEDSLKKRKKFLGIIPVLSKREPFVYSCCMCCSLGAGSLLTGIIFALFSIAYLVVRGNEMKDRYYSAIWVGKNLLPDVWRLLLVFGMLTASLCLLASLILIVASCLWGQKEHYKRLRRCIGFWILSSAIAVLVNIGETVYVQAMPDIIYKEYFHSSDSLQEIKLNATTFSVMTGIHTILFLYLVLVLISYLRLLKYMDSPKIGSTPKPIATADAEKQVTAPKMVKMSQSSRQSTSQDLKESSNETVGEVAERVQSKKKTPLEMKIPDREEKYKERNLKKTTTNENPGDRIYENTNFPEEIPDSVLSSAKKSSKLSVEGQPNEKRKTFKEVLDEIINDDTKFDNMFKPCPLKRMPTNSRKPPVKRRGDEIYMNCNFESTSNSESQALATFFILAFASTSC